MATTDFVVKNGLVVNENAVILETTESTSKSSGALVVSGGLGVNGRINSESIAIGTTFNTDSVLSVGTTSNDTSIAIKANASNISQITLRNTSDSTTVGFWNHTGTEMAFGTASGTTPIRFKVNLDTKAEISSAGDFILTGDLAVNGGDITTTATGTATVFNTNATTINAFGAGTSVNIGAATGTTTINNPTLTQSNATSVTFNMNGPTPTIASNNTGTASIFNSNVSTINFGQAASISMGSTGGTTTVRGALAVNGNTTLGDASGDTITINSNTVSVPNTLTFTLDDAIANNVTYPVEIRHTTSGTPANNIGVGIEFITETSNNNNEVGVTVEGQASSVTAGSENFDFVVKTMTAGQTAVQALRLNNNRLTVGALNTATTITTQLNSNLTILSGETGVTSNGTSLFLKAGNGGSTSGNGGTATIGGGDAIASGAGGQATFRAGVAVGTNIVGSNTIIEAGNGTGTGGSGDIVFRTAQGGVSGSAANTMFDRFYIRPSGAVDVVGTLTIGGDLIVNGLTTTINSNTVSVDDKNIELGSVVAKPGLQATLATGTAVVNLTAGTTIGLIPGMSLSVTAGTGAFGASALVASIQSTTQFTATVNHATAGAVTFTANGASDFTADGGGITLLGTTNKTISWSRTNTRWDSNQNFAAPVLISTASTGTAPLTVSSTTVVSNLNADSVDGKGFGTFTAGGIVYAVSASEGASTIAGLAGQVLASGGSGTPMWVTSTSSNTTSAIVQRDNSGNFSAGTITANLSGTATNSDNMVSLDDRTIAPNEITAGRMRYGFGSWANNNTSPWADYLHLRSYTDATGGNDNLVMFRKDAIGMRIYQQAWGSASSYSTFKDVAFTDQIGNGTLTLQTNGNGISGSTTFTANQSGNGTFTVSSNATSANTASTIVFRDGNGDFNTGGINTVRGISDTSGTGSALRLINPGGASYATSTATVNGAIKIKLPTASLNSSTMMRMTIKIYEYNGATSRTIELGGYNYSLGSWYNTFATMLTGTGSNLNVRFGTDATSDCIWIGETSTVWNYPQVFVTEFQAGYSAYGVETWNDGWSVSFATAFDTVEIGPSTMSRAWTSSDSTHVMTGLSTGATATSGSVTGQWTLGAGSTWQATFADLAEWYTSDKEYTPGTVLVFGGEFETTISTIENDHRVAGVVSTNPAFIMNVDQDGPSACVALQGKVPVRTIGRVQKGDLLVTSNVPGCAMVNNSAAPYTVIGKALENKDYEGESIVYVSVGR